MSDTNKHSLSLSYQIRRAIKAEDALHVAQQEIANLNELLNASYVDPTGKSGLSALLKKVFWPSKLDKEILELVASQAIELEELGTEVTCIPDMREEIVYLKAQLAAQQAQPARPINCGTGHCSCIECPYEQVQPVCGYDDKTGNCTRVNCCKQAQPERGPLSDAELKAIAEAAADKIWPGAGSVGWNDEGTKYHREVYNTIKQGGQQP